jgi:hypothetical protein
MAASRAFDCICFLFFFQTFTIVQRKKMYKNMQVQKQQSAKTTKKMVKKNWYTISYNFVLIFNES